MRYYVCLFGRDSNMMFSENQDEFTSAKKAKDEYFDYIKEAFHGEVVIAYKCNENYDVIMPRVSVKKKSDWRYGTEPHSDWNNRKKFLKFRYMGKAYDV